jgi:hypothetical protein
MVARKIGVINIFTVVKMGFSLYLSHSVADGTGSEARLARKSFYESDAWVVGLVSDRFQANGITDACHGQSMTSHSSLTSVS